AGGAGQRSAVSGLARARTGGTGNATSARGGEIDGFALSGESSTRRSQSSVPILTNRRPGGKAVSIARKQNQLTDPPAGRFAGPRQPGRTRNPPRRRGGRHEKMPPTESRTSGREML